MRRSATAGAKIAVGLLGLCACAYDWVTTVVLGMVALESEHLFPFAVYSTVVTICWPGSFYKQLWAAIAAWTVTALYLSVSWKMNSGRVFEGQLVTLVWLPFILTFNACLQLRLMLEAEPEDHRRGEG